ncbi:hypothetical protein MPSEU_000646600 [Mayamaea pseudoterrestris]|nr:hypothetical protein MPSEU_000646600 [Mayamaea pseudoterrestris]
MQDASQHRTTIMHHCWPLSTWCFLVSLLLGLCTQQRAAVALQIEVCQNKDCCRRFQGAFSLPRVLKDLSLPVTATGCLSLCGKGPNVAVIRKVNGTSTKEYVNGLVDPLTAISSLEPLSGPISPKLKAAVQVMERGQKATSFQDKETLFGSVIRTLELDEEQRQSTALAHALVLRGSARCDARQYETALEDAQLAANVLCGSSTTSDSAHSHDTDLLSKLYRIQAEAYEGMGQLDNAMQALRNWSVSDPSFEKKIAKELTRLQQKLEPN